MECVKNIVDDDIFFFPTKRKEVIKRLRFTLENTHSADMYLDPVSHFAYKGACESLCQAIFIIERLSGYTKVDFKKSNDNNEPNKILSMLYELQDTYVK